MTTVGRIASGYRDTWRGVGPGGQSIMLGTFAFMARAVGFSFLLPLYSKASGLSTEEYGFLFALQNLTPILALVPVLALARRGWDRRLMMIGPSVGLLGMLTLIVARDAPIWVWMIGVMLAGGSSATYWTLGDPLLAEATESQSRSRAYALKWLFFTFGSSLGALVAGAVPDALQRFGGTSERDGYWAMLFGLAALDASQIRIFRNVPIRTLRRHVIEAAEAHVPFRMMGKTLVLLALAETMFGLGYNTIRPYMSLFLTEREGLSSGAAGAVIASTALFAALGALLMPVLAQRIGNPAALACLRLAGASAVAGWFLVGELGAVIALTLLYYGLLDGTSALYSAEVMGRLPSAARDLMAGLNNVMWSAVGAAGAALSGYLQDLPEGGFGLAFSVGIGGYIVSAVWCALVLPRVTIPRVVVPVTA